MPSQRKAPTTKPKRRLTPRVQNIMTNDVKLPIPPSKPESRRRASKTAKGFVETVKEDVRSVVKAVGKFVEKTGSIAPPSKKRNTKGNIVPPFTSPI